MDKNVLILEKLAQREGLSLEDLCAAIEAERDFGEQRWHHLLSAYPDIDTTALPQEFFRELDLSVTPTEAYQRLVIEGLKRELEKAKNNAKGLGSVKNELTEAVYDKFLEGFYGSKY